MRVQGALRHGIDYTRRQVTTGGLTLQAGGRGFDPRTLHCRLVCREQEGYRRFVDESTGERFADADPEYALDAADDVDLEVTELEPIDPEKMPKDLGDPGVPEVPRGSG